MYMYARRGDADQPVNPRSLIGVRADRCSYDITPLRTCFKHMRKWTVQINLRIRAVWLKAVMFADYTEYNTLICIQDEMSICSCADWYCLALSEITQIGFLASRLNCTNNLWMLSSFEMQLNVHLISILHVYWGIVLSCLSIELNKNIHT